MMAEGQFLCRRTISMLQNDFRSTLYASNGGQGGVIGKDQSLKLDAR